MKDFIVGLGFSTLLLVSSCKNTNSDSSYSQKEENTPNQEALSVGAFTTFSDDKFAFTHPLKTLSLEEQMDFKLGRRLFMTNWVPAPASTIGLDGLGPTFNAKSCTRCHVRQGRGLPIEKSRKESFGFLMRISVPGQDRDGGPKPVPGYGGQLEDIGILKVKGEATVTCEYKLIKRMYTDGTSYELREPKYALINPNYGDLPKDLMLSPRVGTQAMGLGFIDGLSEAEILKNEDENDRDNDGISGRANYVWNTRVQKKTIGRFGWKANAPTLEQQIAGAFHQDMGITTPIFPEQNCPDPQYLAQSLPTGDDEEAEVSSEGLRTITFFMSTLSVPARRNVNDPKVMKGQKLFKSLNCVGCHKTGLLVDDSKIYPKMNGTIINPYSDFLLHDMGEALADNRPDYLANGMEWRTQPLWGVGLIKTVNKHSFLLHDGRARSIEEAILWHGGEASRARQGFVHLSKENREALLAFVNSL